jgi:hypothetical protein
LGTCTRALGTGEPGCVDMLARLFFMLETHDPQGVIGHAVVVPKPSR